MAITTQPTQYQTSDGRAFSDKARAERHERLIVAERAYEDARREFARALWETQLTADGQPFTINVRTYYYITPGYFSMPTLREINFYAGIWSMEMDERDRLLIIYKPDGTKETAEHYSIDKLYLSRTHAQIELADQLEAWLKEKQDEVAELIARYRPEVVHEPQS